MTQNSTKLYDIGLFIFRRDLRLDDNKGLLHCLRLSKFVLPCFILDKIQLDQEKNEYFSHNLVQFMAESLTDLNEQLHSKGSRLFLFHGDIEPTITNILKVIKPGAIFLNEDVTPYARKRDKLIQDLCKKNEVKFYAFHDMMLLSKDRVMLSNGQFYQKFTPYYNAAISFNIEKPQENQYTNYVSPDCTYPIEYSIKELDKFYKANPYLEVHGGRKIAQKILQVIKNFKNYAETRNFPILPSTKLSAYNKFGCVSIREVYHIITNEFGKSCDLIKQLYWRDFYYNIVYHYPHVIGDAMRRKYSFLEWDNNIDNFNKWKEGKTGCPIVDAAMRHVNKTGYMPNRLRMVVANYLIKDLLIDWRWGEKYFATKLVDYDPSQNNGGWQWASGTGTDSQPYFRIFNPKLQSQKFDKDCHYILNWSPELKKVPVKSIHDWENDYKEFKKLKIDYPDPIVKHDIQKKKCLEMYKKVSGNDLLDNSYSAYSINANSIANDFDNENNNDNEEEKKEDTARKVNNKSNQKIKRKADNVDLKEPNPRKAKLSSDSKKNADITKYIKKAKS